jgi:hypothetical protein
MNEINTEQISEETDVTLPGEGNGEETPGITTQQGLTEERILELLEANNQKVAEKTAKAFKAQQRMTDKKANQVAKDAMGHLQILKEEGTQLTPEMERAYVNRIVNNYLNSLNDEQPESAQTQPQKESESNPLFGAAKATVNHFAKKYGVTIDETVNPELDKLWTGKKSYQDFLNSADDLLSKLAKADKTPPQARMASLAGNGGSFTKTRETITAELNKLLEHPNIKDRQKIRELKEKLKT